MGKLSYEERYVEQDDPDVPECENCLKRLDDPMHKAHWVTIKVATGPEENDFEEEFDLVCDEPERVICEGCGEEFEKTKTFELSQYEGRFCEECAAEQRNEAD